MGFLSEYESDFEPNNFTELVDGGARLSGIEVLVIEGCFASQESASGKALLVAMPDLDEFWIPKSQIHADSEVFAVNQRGTLIVTAWIAEQKQILEYGTIELASP